jgi:hypothetical protein
VLAIPIEHAQAHRARHRDRWDHDIVGVIAWGHIDQPLAAGLGVIDHRADRAGLLGVVDLQAKGADAALDQRDLPAEGAARQWVAGQARAA